jgi:hypothetical protein
MSKPQSPRGPGWFEHSDNIWRHVSIRDAVSQEPLRSMLIDSIRRPNTVQRLVIALASALGMDCRLRPRHLPTVRGGMS